jgi:nucleolar complex protein 3
VFRRDLTGQPSLEIVRLLNRMIKERQYKIHPNVLSCLLHLRLRSELGVRASNQSADKPEKTERKSMKKKSQNVHLSKKARKSLKEQKEIRKELREAEAEVDMEERKATVLQSELLTLQACLLIKPTPSKPRPSNFSLLYTSAYSRTPVPHPCFHRHSLASQNSLTSLISISSRTS